MNAPESIIVVRQLPGGGVVKVLRADPNELAVRYEEIKRAFPFPRYGYELLSEFENPSEVLGVEDGEDAVALGHLAPQRRDFYGSSSVTAIEPRQRGPFVVRSADLSPSYVMECIRRFGPELDIIAGELHHRVYTMEFVDLLREQFALRELIMSDYDGKCRIVCGPVVLIADDYGKARIEGSMLLELMAQPRVEMYCSRRRQREHFRRAEGGVYFEKSHGPNSEEREAWALLYDEQVVEEYRAKADRIIEQDEMVYRSLNPEKDFLFLREAELRWLCAVLDERKLSFDDLERSELRTILLKSKITPA